MGLFRQKPARFSKLKKAVPAYVKDLTKEIRKDVNDQVNENIITIRNYMSANEAGIDYTGSASSKLKIRKEDYKSGIIRFKVKTLRKRIILVSSY
jgi:hypothetical protein